jgi:hypothetical protein
MEDTSTGELTREIIANKLVALRALEKEITAKRINMHKTGKGWPGDDDLAEKLLRQAPPVPPRTAGNQLQQMTKELLNGAGGLVPEVKRHDDTDLDLAMRRVAVRKSIQLLESAQAEIIAAANLAENIAWAEKHSPEWVALCRSWTIKLAELAAIDARAEALLERAGEARHHIPMTLFTGQGALRIAGETAQSIIKLALAEGLVTEAQIRKARHAD